MPSGQKQNRLSAFCAKQPTRWQHSIPTSETCRVTKGAPPPCQALKTFMELAASLWVTGNISICLRGSKEGHVPGDPILHTHRYQRLFLLPGDLKCHSMSRFELLLLIASVCTFSFLFVCSHVLSQPSA